MNNWGKRLLEEFNSARVGGRKLSTDEIIAITDRMVAVFISEAKPKRKISVALMTEDEWVSSLEREPALKGLDIRREISRAQFWAKQNKRQPTRRFILNWLLKAEKVVDLKAMGATHATGLKLPAPDGPEGWLVWLNTELSLLSEDHPAHGQLLFALNSRKFSGLPASWQARCNSQLRHA